MSELDVQLLMRRVLRALEVGTPKKEIARRLNISPTEVGRLIDRAALQYWRHHRPEINALCRHSQA